jgi:DNA-binding transcriptional LysR family regulator
MFLTKREDALYDRRVLDVNRLRVFRAVVAEGSVNGAATTLGYTPSAVSQQLAALQRETGLTLFERRGRGVVPTAAALTLAEEAEHVLARLAELESVAGDLRSGRLGRLSIGYFASAGAAWIPPVVARLAREFPTLRLDLRLTELVDDPGYSPDLEVFVAHPQVSHERVGYSARMLLDEPYVVALADSHPLASRETVPLAELAAEQWVDNDVSRGPCRQVLLDACASVGITPSFAIEAQDYPTALAFVAEGIGVTVLPRLGAARLPEGVRTVPIVDPEPRRRIKLRVKDAVASHPALVRATELLLERVSASERARRAG